MDQDEADRIHVSPASGRVRSTAACDACRARKVKCVFPQGQTRCSICEDLSIECSRKLPRKKRGPKNRYVQALQAETDNASPQPEQTLTNTSSNLPISPDSTRTLSTSYAIENVAPLPVLEQIVDDWFGWIHPVAPIFHRTQILNRIARAQNTAYAIDTSFLTLLASLCAAVVASLRRRRALYGEVTVDGSYDVAERLGLWDRKRSITLDWVLTMYNFSSATHHEHGIGSALAQRLSAEAAMGVTYLFYHDFNSMSLLDQQMLKRLYWLIYAGQCTCDMHGWPVIILRHVHEPVNALIPLDLSDDALIAGTGDPLNPQSSHSYVPGLVALARLFLIWQESQSVSTKTLEHLQNSMKQARHALEHLPHELKWRSRPGSPMRRENMVVGGNFGTDVQTVNLKVTQLHVRANLLEQMNALSRTQNMLLTPVFIAEERHHVIDELLDILYNMPNEVFDANGYSVVPKIRDIGSALLDDLRTGGTSLDSGATLNLDRLLAKLEELDVRYHDYN